MLPKVNYSNRVQGRLGSFFPSGGLLYEGVSQQNACIIRKGDLRNVLRVLCASRISQCTPSYFPAPVWDDRVGPGFVRPGAVRSAM